MKRLIDVTVPINTGCANLFCNVEIQAGQNVPAYCTSKKGRIIIKPFCSFECLKGEELNQILPQNLVAETEQP